MVIETAEKRVLSRKAIGLLLFQDRLPVCRGDQEIPAEGGFSGRALLSLSVLNEVVLEGGKVSQYEIESEAYISFYSPQRIEFYRNEIKGKRGVIQTAAPAIQVVIPMAGLGSRFAKEGYAKPKPFIDVKGQTMIERVMDNLRIANGRFVLIARQEHLDAEPMWCRNSRDAAISSSRRSIS